MYWFYLTIVFAACAYGMVVVEKSNLNTKFEDIVKAKCAENSKDENAYTELEATVGRLPDCITEGVEGKAPSMMGDLEGFCTYWRQTDAVSCLADMGKKMAPCLPEKEKYMPDFIVGAYTATLNTLCSTEGVEKYNKILSTLDGCQCIGRDDLRRVISKKCSQKLKMVTMINDNEGDYMVTKEDMCSDIQTMKTCAIEELLEECKVDHTELVTMIFEPAMELCSK